MGLKKFEIIIIICALVLSAGLIIYGKINAKRGGTALLTYGEGQEVRLPLDKEGEYDFESEGYVIHIRIKNHAAAFVDSNCPDHICEHYGYLSEEGQIAVCLPAKASLSIVE